MCCSRLGDRRINNITILGTTSSDKFVLYLQGLIVVSIDEVFKGIRETFKDIVDYVLLDLVGFAFERGVSDRGWLVTESDILNRLDSHALLALLLLHCRQHCKGVVTVANTVCLHV
jgi:hypothetical protein